MWGQLNRAFIVASGLVWLTGCDSESKPSAAAATSAVTDEQCRSAFARQWQLTVEGGSPEEVTQAEKARDANEREFISRCKKLYTPEVIACYTSAKTLQSTWSCEKR